MTLPLPDFYDPDTVGDIYHERADRVAKEAIAYRDAHGINPSAKDRRKVAVFGIDCQVGFTHENAPLFVPGSVGDMRRSVEWIYRNLDCISEMHFSMDTHRIYQIFHPAWWLDEEGEHPDPFTTISHDDIVKGRWRPVSHYAEALDYTSKLERSGKYVLTVWPYHTLLGGVSHALNPAVMEASIFHAVARQNQTRFETKGTNQLTENYSVLAPEVCEVKGTPVGQFNTQFYETLLNNDRVYIFGEASSHCVRETIRDILDRIKSEDPDLADRIYILEDAMSPVQPPMADPPPELDFPAIANQAIEEFRDAGMNVVTTDDEIDLG